MGQYSESPVWQDVVPVAQDDGGPNPLALINYTEAYSEAMSYLRAVMASDEKSERVLALTEDIIDMNPAHYTVWLYRADNLFELKVDLLKELAWLDSIALKFLKNYQIWHHRQTIMSRIPSLPDTELPFLSRMFSKDAKNYHVWSYRQWLVRHFSLWETEIAFIEALLDEDVRNNSAWNHRWFILFGRHLDPSKNGIQSQSSDTIVSASMIDHEIDYTESKIALAPQNQSSWNYLRGVIRQTGRPLTNLQSFAERFATLNEQSQVKSSHALDILAEIYAIRKENDDARKALELLANRYDPIRKNYWNYRQQLLNGA